jgi:hypothetical protein
MIGVLILLEVWRYGREVITIHAGILRITPGADIAKPADLWPE